jgi:hypothetical protein
MHSSGPTANVKSLHNCWTPNPTLRQTSSHTNVSQALLSQTGDTKTQALQDRRSYRFKRYSQALNGAAAAVRAGYNADAADRQGVENLPAFCR